MSRSVTFNGVTRFTPGGIVKVNADALNQIGVSAANVVGLIGESDGGVPGSVGGLVTLDDPAQARTLFRSGPLVDAIRLAFESSGDPRIPGGAAQVVIYKVNASTQSYVEVPHPYQTLVSDLDDGSSTTTVIGLTTGGLTVDALTGRWVDIAINSLPIKANLVATGGSTTTATVVTTADLYVGDIVQFDGSTTTAALQDEYATIIANDGTTITFAETLPAAVANTDDFDVLPSYRRKIVDNTAGTLTLDTALPVAPASGDGIFVRPAMFTVTSRDYGTHTAGIELDVTLSASDGSYTVSVTLEGETQTSDSLGGTNKLQLYYRGGANAVATDTVATPASVTSTSVDLTTGGLTLNAHDGATVVITNTETGTSEQVRIATNAAAALTLAAPGLSAAFVSELQAATTINVDILTVTNATAQVVAKNGFATQLLSTITGVTGDDLNLTIGATETLQSLINRINATGTYVAAAADGVNTQTTLASSLDGSTSSTSNPTLINIQREIDRNGGTGFRADLFSVVEWINNISKDLTAVRPTDATLDGLMLPRTDPLVEDVFVNQIQLSGGTRGTSTNSDWQTGFDLLLTRQMDNVVPLIDQDLSAEGNSSTATWASVSQQLLDHVIRARGAEGLERGSFIGFRGTKAEYIAACNSLNDADVACVSQNPTVLDATGTLTAKGPREFAVMAASMRSGVAEVGEPLTHKFIRVSGLTQDTSWDPRNLTDANDLIRAGALFAEVVPGRGTRWVRDLTTWVKSDNLAYSEGSVRSIVRFVAYNLRTTLADRFTGRKAAPATIGAVKDTVSALLELYRTDNIIVDSIDPTTGATIRAFHNLKVFSEGDVLRVNVGIFPVPGINFQLTEIFLQLPSQSA